MSKYITRTDGSQVKDSCFVAWGADGKALDLAKLNSDKNSLVANLVMGGFKVARATVQDNGAFETDAPAGVDCVLVQNSEASLGKIVKYLADGAVKPLSADIELNVEFLKEKGLNSKEACAAYLKGIFGEAVKITVHKARPNARHPRAPKVATDTATVSMTSDTSATPAPASPETPETSTPANASTEAQPAAAPTSPRSARRAARLGNAQPATVQP